MTANNATVIALRCALKAAIFSPVCYFVLCSIPFNIIRHFANPLPMAKQA